MSMLTQEQLDEVGGLPSREAARRLGVAKSTINDARKLARENGGRLPRRKTAPVPMPEWDADGPKENFREDWKGEDGTVDATVAAEYMSFDDIMKKFNRDPEKYRLVGTLSESHWGNEKDGWKSSYKFKTERITDDELDLVADLPLLYSQVLDSRLRAGATRGGHSSERDGDRIPHSPRATVVVWADPQTGKRDSRGGTPELITRMAQSWDKLQLWIEEHPADEAAFLSVGDEVESFENVPTQGFTNDLSFPDQLDLELTFELNYVRLLSETHGQVTVAGTSSNHCAWRKGKDNLGRPGDDYGLYLKKTLERALRLNDDFSHVEFVYPDVWDETNAVTVAGTKIAMAHGHQVNQPNQIADWWKKQAFGRQASADADILLTGHFHHFRMEEVDGGGPDNKPRVWIQAPTMDNGSSWVRNKWGNDSTPGILVFQVTEAGLDMQTLTML